MESALSYAVEQATEKVEKVGEFFEKGPNESTIQTDADKLLQGSSDNGSTTVKPFTVGPQNVAPKEENDNAIVNTSKSANAVSLKNTNTSKDGSGGG